MALKLSQNLAVLLNVDVKRAGRHVPAVVSGGVYGQNMCSFLSNGNTEAGSKRNVGGQGKFGKRLVAAVRCLELGYFFICARFWIHTGSPEKVCKT